MLWAGVPFPPEMYRGPPSPGRAVQASARTPAPRVRTFTSRRPPGRALGGGGRLPGLQADTALRKLTLAVQDLEEITWKSAFLVSEGKGSQRGCSGIFFTK
ncbi:uncharacterized protein LOC116666976 isoform X5 [Camelus ferus]|uniref:Uncharacterized protein LOC116666976 isoform X5 n=1 Tax=Camelus ferus TaxID=419612 RepID=A0A8B8TXN8_CAMFR|nr:uncharacterized protein LOC116666976 isoform X5 [Camelus ferus]